MVKRALLFVAILSSFSFSRNLSLEQFAGVELGYGAMESKNAMNSSESNRGFDFGLKVGVQNYDWRTAFSTNYFKEDKHESLNTLLSVDKFLFAGIYETEDTIMKPYIGANLGWLKYKDSDLDIKDSDITYGFQLGFVWGLSSKLDFDFGYRHSFTAIEEVSRVDIFSLSLNYIF